MSKVVKAPVRTPILDDNGNLDRTWQIFFADVGITANTLQGDVLVTTALPPTPAGFMVVTLQGTQYRVPYYTIP